MLGDTCLAPCAAYARGPNVCHLRGMECLACAAAIANAFLAHYLMLSHTPVVWVPSSVAAILALVAPEHLNPSVLLTLFTCGKY